MHASTRAPSRAARVGGRPECEYDPRRRCPWVLDGAELLPLNTSMSERCARSAVERAPERAHIKMFVTHCYTRRTRGARCAVASHHKERPREHTSRCLFHTVTPPQTRHATHGVPRARSAPAELPGDLGEGPAHHHHNLKQTVPHRNSAIDTVYLHSNSTVSSGRARSPAISAISPRHHTSSWMVQYHNGAVPPFLELDGAVPFLELNGCGTTLKYGAEWYSTTMNAAPEGRRDRSSFPSCKTARPPGAAMPRLLARVSSGRAPSRSRRWPRATRPTCARAPPS
jgi:hypothetical protein